MRLFISFLLLIGGALLCLRHFYHVPVQYDDFWLDSPLTKDPSITNKSYLLSNREVQAPSELEQPVCVLVHGFSASTFEFDYFKGYMETVDSTISFSTVLMGGHGRDYNAFKSATYFDWQAPVIAEIQSLIHKGYSNITLLGVSTGATILLHAMLNGDIQMSKIKQLIFIDPFLMPQNKLLFLTPYLSRIVSNTRSNATHDLELKYWHVNRPGYALSQLVRLLKDVRHQLHRLPADASLPPITVFAAEGDPVGDTFATKLLLETFLPKTIFHLNSSSHHVLIEPTTKKNWSEDDQKLLDELLVKIRNQIKETN